MNSFKSYFMTIHVTISDLKILLFLEIKIASKHINHNRTDSEFDYSSMQGFMLRFKDIFYA